MTVFKKIIKKKRCFLAAAIVVASSFTLQACVSSETVKYNDNIHKHSDRLKYNQVGYYPHANKVMIFPSRTPVTFKVKDDKGNTVLDTQSSSAGLWEYSGEIVVSLDVTSLREVGQYTLTIDGESQAIKFLINDKPYEDLHTQALRAFYFNRASLELLPEYAGKFARPLGHPDTKVYVHESAASATQPTGSIISSPKGWYDAGDYNKYIVNSGISTYTLLLAYDHFSQLYNNKSLNIPESKNNIADILDEIAWNIEWMSTMQDPSDGGVYHKLTSANFAPIVMPHQSNESRYVVQKTTAAALNFAAVMAYASRIYQAVDKNLSRQYLLQSINAYIWATKNPRVYYRQPSDIKTGEYGDNEVSDEFAWASAELFISTGERKFIHSFNQLNIKPEIPSWSQSSALGYISLLSSKYAKDKLNNEELTRYRAQLLELADALAQKHSESVYSVAMEKDDFVWGSNGVAMNQALLLWQAYRLTNDDIYKSSAEGLVNYVLGTNPTGYSFVTGFGKISPRDPHHRQSAADNVNSPIPGFLVGGPHSGQQDKCNYPSIFPAQSFLDDWCSYSTNEVTINWNAPFVYSLAQMNDSYK